MELLQVVKFLIVDGTDQKFHLPRLPRIPISKMCCSLPSPSRFVNDAAYTESWTEDSSTPKMMENVWELSLILTLVPLSPTANLPSLNPGMPIMALYQLASMG